MKKNKKIEFLLYCLLFLILTIPRSINEFFPITINFLKIIAGISIIVWYGFDMILRRKIKISSLTKNVILYSIFLLIVTLFNKVPIETFLKVYVLNLSILLLCEKIFRSKHKMNFLLFYPHYFLFLILLNLVLIFYGYSVGNPYGSMVPDTAIYLLGSDNRFILYILPALIGFYYLITIQKKNINYKIKFLFTYIISLSSLLINWSVAAMVVLLLIGILYILFSLFKKIKINIYIVSLGILVLSILIVFFKVQFVFDFFITNVLHKSLDLSYRSILWDDAIFMLKNNIENLFFGFGYCDISNMFVNMPLQVIHLHNIVMNNIFFSGIFGTIIYFYSFYLIEKNIKKIENIKSRNIFSLIFLSILVLMIFDTFELYQIYYFILFILYYSKNILENEKE